MDFFQEGHSTFLALRQIDKNGVKSESQLRFIFMRVLHAITEDFRDFRFRKNYDEIHHVKHKAHSLHILILQRNLRLKYISISTEHKSRNVRIFRKLF